MQKIAASAIANTNEDRSNELTRAASAQLEGAERKQRGQGSSNSGPHQEDPRTLIYLGDRADVFFCQKAAIQEIVRIRTDWMANASVESTFFSPALERTTAMPAIRAAASAKIIHIDEGV